MNACDLKVERLNGGHPILSPINDGWESWQVFNAATVYLPNSPENQAIIAGILPGHDLSDPRLADGVVAVYYRACPKKWKNFPPSFVGLAVFTPTLDLLKRWPAPLMTKGDDPDGYDYTSAEDPRITRIGDTFYMLYCGYTIRPDGEGIMSPCYAVSRDLLHWEKRGPFRGEVTSQNKDHVLFSGMHGCRCWMVHRPMTGREQHQFAIALASSDAPDGVWTHHGDLFGAEQQPGFRARWNGAGAPPLPLGDGRFLMVYHVGEWHPNGDRTYYTDTAILDMNRFTPDNPAAVVESRLEHLMSPEVEYEKDAPDDPDAHLNCLFACGAYVFGGDLYIIYGAANEHVMAARVNLGDLLAVMDGLRR